MNEEKISRRGFLTTAISLTAVGAVNAVGNPIPNASGASASSCEKTDWQILLDKLNQDRFYGLCGCEDVQLCDRKGISVPNITMTVIDAEALKEKIPEYLKNYSEQLLGSYQSLLSSIGQGVAGAYRSAVRAFNKLVEDLASEIDIFLAAYNSNFSSARNDFYIPGRMGIFEDRRNLYQVGCHNLIEFQSSTVADLKHREENNATPSDLNGLTDKEKEAYKNIVTNLGGLKSTIFQAYHQGLSGKDIDELKQVQTFMRFAAGWEDKIALDLSKIMDAERVSGIEYVEMLGMRSGMDNLGDYKGKYHPVMNALLNFDWVHMDPMKAVDKIWKDWKKTVRPSTSIALCVRPLDVILDGNKVTTGQDWHNGFETLLNRTGQRPYNVLFEGSSKSVATVLEIPGHGVKIFGWDTYGDLSDYKSLFKGNYVFTKPYLVASFPISRNSTPKLSSSLSPSSLLSVLSKPSSGIYAHSSASGMAYGQTGAIGGLI